MSASPLNCPTSAILPYYDAKRQLAGNRPRVRTANKPLNLGNRSATLIRIVGCVTMDGTAYSKWRDKFFPRAVKWIAELESNAAKPHLFPCYHQEAIQ